MGIDDREPPADDELADLAEAILQGRTIDWLAVEAGASPEARPLIEQLRLLTDLVAVHRRLPPAEPPRQWAHLSLLERLGAGAFGEVFRAWDPRLDREVALKLISDVENDSATLSQFEEGRLLARVRHANVITVYGAERIGNEVGIWAELIHGRTLEQWIREQGPLGASEAAAVGVDLCRALAAVHAAGVLHRDVKARNVMREDGGRIVLMDFGAGRKSGSSSRADTATGTPLYLAPELLENSSATEQSDIYSLGVLLFYLVTGSYPVQGHSVDELRAAHREGRRQRLRDARPDLPELFINSVERALEADPAARHRSAGEFETALRRAQDPVRDTPARERETADGRRRFPIRIVALAAASAVLLAAGWLFDVGGVREKLTNRADRTNRAVERRAMTEPIRLAVLPFATSAGPEDASFGDGLTVDLIDRLNAVSGLRVVSRTSAFAFRQSELALSDIGARLNVTALLTGEVRRSGEAIEIRSRLVRSADQGELWSRAFVRPLAEIFAVQAEIATEVAAALRLERPDTRNPWPTSSLAAYESYLRGRSALEVIEKTRDAAALKFFERAIELDPDYAQAHAGIAIAYSQLAFTGGMAPQKAYDPARNAAEKALAIDGESSEAHLASAMVKFTFEWDWSGLERECQRAIELDPENVTARELYASALISLDRPDEALAQAQLAESLDPLSPRASYRVAMVHRYARRYEACISQARRTLEIDPHYGWAHISLGHCYRGLGRFEEAIAEYRLGGCGNCGALGIAFAQAGRTGEARLLLAEREAGYRKNGVGAGHIAQIYIGLGEVDLAFEWLERAFDDRAFMKNLKDADVFDPLRADPRFELLLDRIGFGTGEASGG